MVCKQHGIGHSQGRSDQGCHRTWAARLAIASPEERPAVHSPQDAAALVQYEMSALEQEELRVMLLDMRNRVLDIVDGLSRFVEFLPGAGG